MCVQNLKFVPEIIAIEILTGGCERSILREEEAVGVGDGTIRKSVVYKDVVRLLKIILLQIYC